jgi:hypothetical protein
MDQFIGIRSIMFVLVGPVLVLLLYWAASWSVPPNAEGIVWSMVGACFVLFVPGLILAQIDQAMSDRKVCFRSLYLVAGVGAVGYALLGLLALRVPQALTALFWLPLVFALPYGFCSWASVQLAQLASR